MQCDPDRLGHVLVDRVPHKLMAEHQRGAFAAEQSGLDGWTEFLDQLAGPTVGDTREVNEREGVAQQRGAPQRRHRWVGQVAEPAHDELAQRIGKLRAGGLCARSGQIE
jgi:hypothetical protein